MFESYKIGQPVFYNVIKNAVLKNKLSHAYLIVNNDNENPSKIIKDAIKYIIASNFDTKEYEKVSDQIDKNNFVDLVEIFPDGMWIKKEQLSNLKDELNKKSISLGKRFYIINEVEKLNDVAGNSMLKFLEEPDENVIAFLITNNLNMILKTIISRCQIIILRNNQILSSKALENIHRYLGKNSELESVDYEELINNVFTFVNEISKSKDLLLIDEKSLILDKYKTREELLLFFDLLINLHDDLLKISYDKNNLFFADYVDKLKEVLSNIKNDTIVDRLKIMIDLREEIKYNVNVNLIIDKLIILLGRC